MKLSLKIRYDGEVIIVHCQGRIVYRDEAAAFSQFVGGILENRAKIVLDLAGVSFMDSAGIGELVCLHTAAQEREAELKVANPSPFVRRLFGLTHLDSFLDIHSSVSGALTGPLPADAQEVCADC